MFKRIESRIVRALNWTSPSWVTIGGGILALIGITLFQYGHDWPAIAVLTVSFLTDWWDGALARHQQGKVPTLEREQEDQIPLWERLNIQGVTHLGRGLDPLIDKIRFLGLLWVVGHKIIDVGVMVSLTIMAVLLTIARPIKRWLELDHAGSNQWGKYKVYTEVILIVILVFGTRPLYGGPNPAAELMVTRGSIHLLSLSCLFLAVASGWTHLESGYLYWYTRR